MTRYFYQPIADQLLTVERWQTYLLLFCLTALSVPLLHIYLQVQLSWLEMLWHIGLVASQVLVTALMVELVGYLFLADKFGQTQIQVWQFWLATGLFYLPCDLSMTWLLQHLELASSIALKHQLAGHSDMQLKTMPLFFVIIFIATQILLQRKLRQDNLLLQAAEQLKPNSSAAVKTSTATLTLRHQDQTITIELALIMYIQVVENYCHIWVSQTPTPIRYLQRSTLGEIQQQLSHPCWVQCHRSYAVNLDYLSRPGKHGRNVFLTLLGMDAEIPVSRNRVAAVRQAIELRHAQGPN